MLFGGKEKSERKFNESLRDLRMQKNLFAEVGRVVYIGKCKDDDGNLDTQNWNLEDTVVICFEIKKEYYKGFIKGLNLALCGFTPKYGQYYRFHSNKGRELRENFTLVQLSMVTSVI